MMFSFQLKKNGSSAKFNMVEAVQPTAAKYMKRFLSPTSQDRQPLPTKQVNLIRILSARSGILQVRNLYHSIA